MKSLLKQSLNITYYLLPPLVLGYVLSVIGFKNILETTFLLGLDVFILALVLKLMASVCRIIKYRLVNSDQGFLENSRLFLTARVGSELSILGQFSPMLHAKNRNMGIFCALFIDRYLEIFSTFLIAAIFSLINVHHHSFFLLSALLLSGAVMGMLVLLIVPLGYWNRIPIIGKLSEIQANIKNNLKKSHSRTLNLLLLSLLASALEFYLVVIIFAGLGQAVEFGIVAVIWAISGIVSNLMLVTIGPAEITSIYLFKTIALISASVVASSIILGKVITMISFLAIYSVNSLLGFFSKQPFSART